MRRLLGASVSLTDFAYAVRTVKTMETEIGHQRRLELVTELCRALSKYSVNIGLSDARPAVSVRSGLVNPKLWISVSACGQYFVWRRYDEMQHPVEDPTGAAAQIAAYLKGDGAVAGEPS